MDLFTKWANWVPSDALQPRVTERNVRGLLASAAAANMVMIRVWGGGIYEHDFFYDAADKEGLLLF